MAELISYIEAHNGHVLAGGLVSGNTCLQDVAERRSLLTRGTLATEPARISINSALENIGLSLESLTLPQLETVSSRSLAWLEEKLSSSTGVPEPTVDQLRYFSSITKSGCDTSRKTGK